MQVQILSLAPEIMRKSNTCRWGHSQYGIECKNCKLLSEEIRKIVYKYKGFKRTTKIVREFIKSGLVM